MGTKTLKISESVHRELKVYVAKSGDNMTVFADAAIIALLVTKGHRSSKSVNKPKK